MGLDISAYRKLARIDGKPTDEQMLSDSFVHVFPMDPFPGRDEGLAEGWHTGEPLRFSARNSFPAGSYSGYSTWREWLAKLAGYTPEPYFGPGGSHKPHSAGAWAVDGGPFWELIEFSDCEGVIGPVVAAKLAKDFAEFDERAKAAADNSWHYDAYTNWRRAFEWAADGGCVYFH